MKQRLGLLYKLEVRGKENQQYNHGDPTDIVRNPRDQMTRYTECVIITKTRLFKYIENFTTKKLKIFRWKNSNIIHISVQNIDCRYSLEPPRRGGSNEYPQSMFLSRSKKIIYTPVNPSFAI